MNARELIAELSKYPPEAPVYVNDGADYCPEAEESIRVEWIEYDGVRAIPFHPGTDPSHRVLFIVPKFG